MASANANKPSAPSTALAPINDTRQAKGIVVPRAPALYPRDVAAKFIDHRPLIALTIALAIGGAIGAALRD